MQKILNDIELDVHELVCLVESLKKRDDATLRRVACRNISLLKTRLESLQVLLEDVPASEPEGTPVPEPLSSPSQPEEDTPVADTQPAVRAAIPASAPILAERIRSRSSLRHSMSLNDSFRYARELFGGDTERMNLLLRQLDEAGGLDEALEMAEAEVLLDEENPAAADFLELLRRHFDSNTY